MTLPQWAYFVITHNLPDVTTGRMRRQKSLLYGMWSTREAASAWAKERRLLEDRFTRIVYLSTTINHIKVS